MKTSNPFRRMRYARTVMIVIGACFALRGLSTSMGHFSRAFASSDKKSICTERPDGTPAQHFDNTAWRAFLKKYVQGGAVNFELAKAQEPAPDIGIAALKTICPSDYAAWAPEEQLAFWINLYNIYVVNHALTQSPPQSVMGVGANPDAIYQTKFVNLAVLAYKPRSLSYVENEIMRKKFYEPRIHFALACLKQGCPALRNVPYVALNLDSQLTEVTQKFLRDSTKNRYDAANNTLYLSPIFNWYRGDFGKTDEDLIAFVAQYIDPSIGSTLLGAKPKIAFLSE